MVKTPKKCSRKRNQKLSGNLFDYFTELMSIIDKAEKSGAVRILFFNPLQFTTVGRIIQRGPKYILCAKDKGTADALCKRLDAVPSPLSLRQNIVYAKGDVFLSVKSAYTSHRVDINEVIQDLQKESEDADNTDPLLRDALNRLIRWRDEHGSDALVSERCECGKSWRVTWFDPERERRCQAGLGDVFFVYGDNVGQVREAPERRKRADRGDEHVICKLPSSWRSPIEFIDRSKH